jgi:NAD(P)H dehydrogenase (quinone)
MAKVFVVFYSMYGHTAQLAREVAAGAASVEAAGVQLFRVPDLMDEETLKRVGAWDAQQHFADVPLIEPEQLVEADAIIVGTPTRFGNMCGQMRQFLDATGKLWSNGALVGKAGSVFTSSATQHGGQESTILSTHITLLHLGMVIVGLPYSYQGQMDMSEITGGSPYGASTIVGGKGERFASANELAAARFQGKHVAAIATRLAR